MTESRSDRCVLVFVLCLGVLLLVLQVASSPSGQAVPASIVAIGIIGGMCATAIETIRSQVPGWNKRIVKIIGALFALMAVWLICDSPPDFRTALLDLGLAVVLLVTSFRKTRPAGWATSDEPTP